MASGWQSSPPLLNFASFGAVQHLVALSWAVKHGGLLKPVGRFRAASRRGEHVGTRWDRFQPRCWPWLGKLCGTAPLTHVWRALPSAIGHLRFGGRARYRREIGSERRTARLFDPSHSDFRERAVSLIDTQEPLLYSRMLAVFRRQLGIQDLSSRARESCQQLLIRLRG